jgi:F0F1-type ATP synthase membrane subunit b/b'
MNSQSLNYLYTLLGTVAVMSILVMDEEVLVLLCWVTFVGLAYTYGASAVNAMFDERRAKFSEDILSSYNLQEEALKALINYHTIQTLIIAEVKQLFDFSKSEISRILAKRQTSFKSIIASQIEQKLSILADKEHAVASQVQDTINLTVSQNVLTLFSSDTKDVKKLKEKILSESMAKFETIAKA